MTFVDPRELRLRKIALLRSERERATTDVERANLDAELRELTKFHWRRLLWPNGPLDH